MGHIMQHQLGIYPLRIASDYRLGMVTILIHKYILNVCLCCNLFKKHICLFILVSILDPFYVVILLK